MEPFSMLRAAIRAVTGGFGVHTDAIAIRPILRLSLGRKNPAVIKLLK
jgi:hypothetical protein